MAYTLAKKTKIVEAILKEYAQGQYTIKSICKSQGITYRTFRIWEMDYQNTRSKQIEENCEKYPSERQTQPVERVKNDTAKSITNTTSYKSAKENRFDIRKGKLKELAMIALEKHLSTWEVEERSQVAEKNSDGTQKAVKFHITKKAHFPPPMLVKFVLEKTDPDTFGNTIENFKNEGNAWIELMKSIPIDINRNS